MTGKMGIPNHVDLKLCLRMSEAEFLTNLNISANVPRAFLLHILLHAIHYINNFVPKMFGRFLERKKISTKLQFLQGAILL